MCAPNVYAGSSDGAAADVAGYDLKFKPYIEVEGGYDSNPDNLVAKEGSSFEKMEAGLRASAERKNQYHELNLKVRDVRFNDLDRSNRWEIKAAWDSTFELSDSETLKTGTSFFRDFFSLDRANIYHSYTEYAKRTEDYRLRLQARSHVEQNIGDDGQRDETDTDIFNISRGKAFDYSKSDGQVSLLTFTRYWVQPFAIYDLADLDYFNQVSNPLVDRNALEQYGVAGLRFQFNKDFRIDVGGRVNDRDFNDKTIDRKNTAWVDVNAYWQPTDDVKLTALLERVIKEPSTSFGLADDVRTVGATFDWDFCRNWSLAVAGYYDRVEPIGDDLRYNKYLTTATLSYEPNDNLELFLSTLGKWVNEEVTGESYDRYKIGAGARLKF